MLERFAYLVWSLPKRYPLFVSIIFLAGVGGLDYFAGYEVHLSALYLFPLLFIGLAHSAAYNYGLAIVCAWVEAVAKITATPDAVSNPVFFWNIAMNAILYVLFAALLSSFKGRLLKKGDSQSQIDSVTGLHNIVGFHELALAELQRSRRYNRQLTLVYFDCHSFRPFNASGGVMDSEDFLLTISQIMKDTLRISDLLFRWREDEFLFLLPETDQTGAMMFAKRLRASVKTKIQEQGWAVTFSIGVAVFEQLPTNLTDMLKKAEKVLAEARQSSQNSIGFRVF